MNHLNFEKNNNTPEEVVEKIGKLIKKTDELGTIRYFNENKKLHRDDGPAVIFKLGEEYWYKNGLLHRVDGPAITKLIPVGYKLYYQNGYLHREDGPTFCCNGNEYWYFKGVYHRLNGPAIIHADGTEEFWIHGIKQCK